MLPVASIDVPDVEAAVTLRFLGSPSIRVNGVDIEPGRQHDSPFFGCRTYTVQGKTVGVPPEEWISKAVRAASHFSATRAVFTKKGNLARSQIPYKRECPPSLLACKYLTLRSYGGQPSRMACQPSCPPKPLRRGKLRNPGG